MVRQDLDQVLARFTDADVSWSPGQGARTVGGQLFEIVGKEVETLLWIQQGEWPEEVSPFDPNSSTIAEMRTVLGSIREETFTYLDSQSEADLRRMIPCPDGWWEALRLTECPQDEILRNIAMHEWYHTGQLVSYLWIRGDDPYSW